eukprot:c3232_g1_i1.p1 GENE.c3232_g1_i1~~c3232_g1_i1.p1  ORF type:complete len:263 (+),score=75.71 c3232_g1_i1:47-790(+)
MSEEKNVCFVEIVQKMKKACIEGDTKIVESILIEYGNNEKFNINEKVEHGHDTGTTFLHLACTYGKLEVVKLLLNHPKINLYIEDSYETHPFICAIDSQNEELVKFFCNLSSFDVNYNNSLFEAAHLEKYTNMLPILLKHPSIEINKADDSGWTALHLASRNCNLKGVKILCESGADYNYKNMRGETPFHLCCEYDGMEVVEYLYFNCNIDVNLVTNEGYYPLMTASYYGNYDVVKFLCENTPVDVK